jgi:hypothetical protein
MSRYLAFVFLSLAACGSSAPSTTADYVDPDAGGNPMGHDPMADSGPDAIDAKMSSDAPNTGRDAGPDTATTDCAAYTAAKCTGYNCGEPGWTCGGSAVSCGPACPGAETCSDNGNPFVCGDKCSSLPARLTECQNFNPMYRYGFDGSCTHIPAVVGGMRCDPRAGNGGAGLVCCF